jgi:two-component system, sensor histidine kinase and response regulator
MRRWAPRPGYGRSMPEAGDISERLEVLQDIRWELSESEVRFRNLLDSQDDIILRRDGRGRLTFVNRAFCRAFGVERDDVLGTEFWPRVVEGNNAEPLMPDNGKRRQVYVQRIETTSGRRWISWEEYSVPAIEGGMPEVQALGRDITEQRRVEAELREARADAEAANRAKSRFLAAMSHEIRTPMNGILGMANLLGDTPMSHEQRTYVHAVDRSAKTLLALIDEILDFSKIEAGKMELEASVFSIEDSIQGVVELLATRAHEKRIEIGWAIDPALPRFVVGDEARIRQIVTNLVGNAIKFTGTGGVLVTVALADRTADGAPRDLRVAIAVKDTGSGIPPETLMTLFTDFEQGDTGVSRRHGGTGLGLAISRRLARAMSGDVTIETTVGLGSTFTATLSLARAEPVIDARQPDAEIPGHHVLISMTPGIETTALRLNFEGGHVPAEVADPSRAAGMIAAAAAESAAFNILIVDGRGDVEAAGRLLRVARDAVPNRTVRGLVIVDPSARAAFDQFRTAGFDGYLVRPIRPKSLLAQLSDSAPSLLEPDEPIPGASAPLGIAPGTRLRRVLLAEDNDINALLARRMLERAGCETVHVTNGRDAVDCLRRTIAQIELPYDIVLMDVHMPVMDGLKATAKIQEMFARAEGGRHQAPPIVALTANAFEEDRRRCLEMGMDGYLSKPFDRNELEAMLETWCGSTRKERAGQGGPAAA